MQEEILDDRFKPKGFSNVGDFYLRSRGAPLKDSKHLSLKQLQSLTAEEIENLTPTSVGKYQIAYTNPDYYRTKNKGNPLLNPEQEAALNSVIERKMEPELNESLQKVKESYAEINEKNKNYGRDTQGGKTRRRRKGRKSRKGRKTRRKCTRKSRK